MPHPTRRRNLRPSLERVEDRALLSSSALLAFNNHRSAAVAAAARPFAVPVPPADNALISPAGNPSRREVARQRFRATFNGPFTVGPGRFDTQARLLNVRGTGRDTYSLHADVQIGIVVPANPNQPTTGVLTIYDRNTNSGTVVALDLTADPTSVDAAGRPNRFVFQTNDTLSSGVFAQSTSSGTVEIRYNGRSGRRGLVRGAGNASVVVSGSAYTLGVTNALRNSDIN